MEPAKDRETTVMIARPPSRALPQIQKAAKRCIVSLSTRIGEDWLTARPAPAHWRLRQEGRRSRVSHPSEAQRRFEIRDRWTSRGAVFK
jgi:hypothetical protein